MKSVLQMCLLSRHPDCKSTCNANAVNVSNQNSRYGSSSNTATAVPAEDQQGSSIARSEHGTKRHRNDNSSEGSQGRLISNPELRQLQNELAKVTTQRDAHWENMQGMIRANADQARSIAKHEFDIRTLQTKADADTEEFAELKRQHDIMKPKYHQLLRSAGALFTNDNEALNIDPTEFINATNQQPRPTTETVNVNDEPTSSASNPTGALETMGESEDCPAEVNQLLVDLDAAFTLDQNKRKEGWKLVECFVEGHFEGQSSHLILEVEAHKNLKSEIQKVCAAYKKAAVDHRRAKDEIESLRQAQGGSIALLVAARHKLDATTQALEQINQGRAFTSTSDARLDEALTMIEVRVKREMDEEQIEGLEKHLLIADQAISKASEIFNQIRRR